MSFEYRQQRLHADDLPLAELAQRYGTPLYVYSKTQILSNWQAFAAHWPAPHRLCYAVKANSNLAVLQLLAQQGAGFDIVSGGELARVLAAGGEAHKVVFSGVAKSVPEIEQALSAGIGCFNVESIAELDRIQAIAKRMQVTAPVSLRVNPDVDAKTHPYIATGLKANKFGIPMQAALDAFRHAAQQPNLNVVGADCHIGSQILSISPFLDAADIMLNLVQRLRAEGIHIQHLDLGGGLGIPYQHEPAPAVADYLQQLLARAADIQDLSLWLEPGRAIVGNAGVLVTQVEYLKPSSEKTFMLVDAGMNDLLRPALYSAYHDIVPVQENTQGAAGQPLVDVVGPVCETGDFLGHARHLHAAAGDLLAVLNAGAYGFTMSSNYNTRCRPAEVMVSGSQAQVVRARESLSDLWRGEQLFVADAQSANAPAGRGSDQR